MPISNNTTFAIGVVALCLIGNSLSAGEPEVLKPLDRPDRASITVPVLVATSKEDRSYFYKPGVSYEKAFSDLDACRMYSLQVSLAVVLPPKFVPLGSAAVRSESKGPSPQFFMMYGLAGALFAEVIIQSAEDDTAEAVNRRCMAYKGYSRYGTSAQSWKQIAAGTDADRLARMALIASGPQPSTGEIGP